jgi:periodic tryptophan protein 1
VRQVWVYEEGNETESGNMYVHHDLMLSSFPLSVAWLDCVPDVSRSHQPGNLVAIGTFNPEIEIWDLDTLDAVEPAGLLGGYEAGGQVCASRRES